MISRSVGWSSALVPDACRPAWRIVQRNSSRARGACRRRRFRCSCGGRPGTVPSGPPLEPRPAFPLTTAAAAPAAAPPAAAFTWLGARRAPDGTALFRLSCLVWTSCPGKPFRPFGPAAPSEGTESGGEDADAAVCAVTPCGESPGGGFWCVCVCAAALCCAL